MKFPLTVLLGWLLCCGLVGCSSLAPWKSSDESKKDSPWWKKEEELPPPEMPKKIVAIWSNSVFNQPGMEPVRGLGGRVYFYNSEHQPVRVDGQLSVFLYDDTEEEHRDLQEASKRIDFSAAEVASKFTPTEFGSSYSFWVPWDEVDGEQTQLSVIPVFTSNQGEMLVGEQARYLLPGKKPPELADKDKRTAGGVVPVSYEDDATEHDEAGKRERRLQSTTIKVPPLVQRRLKLSNARATNNRPRRGAIPGPTVSNLRQDGAASGRTFGMSHRKPAGAFGQRTSTLTTRTVSSLTADPETTNEQTAAAADRPDAGVELDPQQIQALRAAQSAAPTAGKSSMVNRAKSFITR